MATATEIIQRCGGFKAVADWLGLDRSGVQRWTYEPPKGTGDRIPQRHWQRLIEAAQANGIEVRVDELLGSEMLAIAQAQGQAA